MPRCGECGPRPTPACGGVVLYGRVSGNLSSRPAPVKTLDYHDNYLVDFASNYILILKIKLYISKYK